jgi:hypothetical protein
MGYYYTDADNAPRGPVTLEQLQALAAAGTIDASTYVVPVGEQQWVPLQSVIPSASFRPTNEPLAIVSFVLSLLGFACLGPIMFVPGVICGHIALYRLNRNPTSLGKGFAIAGVIIGYIGFVIWVVVMLLYFGLIVWAIRNEGRFPD